MIVARRLRSVLVGALALALLYFVARRVDWPATLRCLTGLGWFAPVVALPYLGVLLCDSTAWRCTFMRSRRFPLTALMRLRAAAEALANSLPAGIAVAEPFKAIVLQRRFGMSMPEAAANVVVSKIALTIAHALFLVLGLSLAIPMLHAYSEQLLGGRGLEYIAIGVAIALLMAACGALVILSRGRVLGGAIDALLGVAGPRLRARLASVQLALHKVDDAFSSVRHLPKTQFFAAVALFFCGWMTMGLENWLILRLISPGLPVPSAASIEAVVSIVRVAFFFLPSALGAQEASYFALLSIYGVPHAEVVAAAFVVTKRAKELVWIGAGYVSMSTLKACETPLTIAPSGTFADLGHPCASTCCAQSTARFADRSAPMPLLR